MMFAHIETGGGAVHGVEQPALDADKKMVRAGNQQVGDIEATGIKGVGMTPCLLAVEINLGRQIHRIEHQPGAFSLAQARGVECPAVIPDHLFDPAAGEHIRAKMGIRNASLFQQCLVNAARNLGRPCTVPFHFVTKQAPKAFAAFAAVIPAQLPGAVEINGLFHDLECVVCGEL